ncbi:MAG TPA: NYN domain-containing protein [Steroidobacteraceae bacterium]|nr:NYN domain-containing protein [Steroidobacteraceae bacterium]
MEKVAIFVDVQNIYYTCREAYGAQFDYSAFWRRVTDNRDVVEATAFAIDRGDQKQRRFQEILRSIGFNVKLKPYIRRADGSAKGDWDVGIVLDVLEAAPKVDTIVLASGDGDFDLLVQRLRDRHKLIVEVDGVPQLTARSLVDSATRFSPIDTELLLSRTDD